MAIDTFTPDEREKIYAMAENMTGNCQQGSYRREIIISNVLRRVQVKKSNHLDEYLQSAIADDQEFAQLLSAFTIHTTEWFREMPHYKKFEALLVERFKGTRQFRMHSGGCSTGEEVYSFGLVLEAFRNQNAGFDYDYQSFDIDPVSVEIAKKGIYPMKDFLKIPQNYQNFVKKMDKEDSFSPDPNIKTRSHFYTDNLIKLQNMSPSFEVIVCRNVLIYFTPDKVKEIIAKLVMRLVKGGVLIIGHSDSLDPKAFNLKSMGNSMFEKL
jgi:chemotaxis protein methyltransferase CheR